MPLAEFEPAITQPQDQNLHYKHEFADAVSEIIAGCYENHKKHTNTLRTKCRGLLMLKQVVHIVTTVLLGANMMLLSATINKCNNVLFVRHVSAIYLPSSRIIYTSHQKDR
jgi:hypothetical protein